jgi:hypothetical protein
MVTVYVSEAAWEMQQKNIESFVKNYVLENIVNRLTQGKLHFFSHLLLEHQMILTHSRCILAFIGGE